ncbi:MAG: ABC transporter permease [Candidatus Cyclobacteriaceae bacterium M3_2C_046]
MIFNYIKIYLRNLRKNKTISFINVFGLAISMSVCLLLILIVADQYAYDNFHNKRHGIYRIITDRLQQKEYLWSTATTAYPLADVLSSHESVEQVATLKKGFSGVAQWEEAEIPFNGMYASNSFLQMFDYPLSQGNRYTALNSPNAIVLTKKLAEKIFGQENPLNQVMQVEGLGEFVVTGVLAAFPGKTHLKFDALASTARLPVLQQEGKTEPFETDWHHIYMTYVYVNIKERAEIEDIQPVLDMVAQSNYEADSEFEYTFIAQPLTDITPGPLLSNTSGFGLPMVFIYVMLGMALVVLSSAAFNYANLTTARAIKRAREIGIRKVVGARKKSIIIQFIIEAIIMALIAFGLAILIVEYLHPMLNNMFVSLGAPFQFDKTPYLYWIFLGFALITGLAAGLVPAFFFAATDPLVALKKSINIGRFGKHKRRFNIRKLLVVVQFAFSIIFVITMLALYQQMQLVMKSDHGFRTEGVVTIDLQGLAPDHFKSEFSQLANVTSVAATSHMPALGTNNTTEYKREGMQESMNLSYIGADHQYLDLMGLELIAGRNFPENIPEEEQYVILNQTAVKNLGWQLPDQAIGQIIEMDDHPVEIIGIIRDFHYERMDNSIGPMGLRYLPDRLRRLIVTINTEQEKQTLAGLEQGWAKHTARPFDYSFYKDDLRLSYGHFEALIKVLGYVTLVVISLASLGLLGMVIFHVQHKTREIGIRKILGASGKQILFSTGKSFFILILISYVIGGPISYFVNEMWLQNYAYRIDFGLMSLLTGFGLVVIIVALTLGSQFYRAMRVNPVEVLQQE